MFEERKIQSLSRKNQELEKLLRQYIDNEQSVKTKEADLEKRDKDFEELIHRVEEIREEYEQELLKMRKARQMYEDARKDMLIVKKSLSKMDRKVKRG